MRSGHSHDQIHPSESSEGDGEGIEIEEPIDSDSESLDEGERLRRLEQGLSPDSACYGKASASHGKTQAAFIHKLYSMVQTPLLRSLIAWSDSEPTTPGMSTSSFSVYNATEFSRAVLPQFFKHNNWQSFVRQLNMYGFHKVSVNDMFNGTGNAPSSYNDGAVVWEFQHPNFQYGRPDLLSLIKRKSSKIIRGGVEEATSGNEDNSSIIASRTVYADSRAPLDPISTALATGTVGSAIISRGYTPLDYSSQPLAAYSTSTYATEDRSRDPNRSSEYSESRESSLPTPVPRHLTSQAQFSALHGHSRTSPYVTKPQAQQYATRTIQSPSLDESQYAIDLSSARTMESSIKMFGEVLYRHQHEFTSNGTITHQVLRLLFDVVASMDHNGEHQDHLDAASDLIAKLDPALLYVQQVNLNLPAFPANTLSYSSLPPQAQHSWASRPLSDSNPQLEHHQPHQLQQYVYSHRPVPMAESYARGSSNRTDLLIPGNEDQNYSNYPVQAQASSYTTAPLSNNDDWSQQPLYTSIPTPRSAGFSANGAYPSPRSSTWSGPVSSSLPPVSHLLSDSSNNLGQRRTLDQEINQDEQRKRVRQH